MKSNRILFAFLLPAILITGCGKKKSDGSTDVTLSGGANDVWIFQIAKDLKQANGINVTLAGGAQAKNIFWQVSGQAIIGTTATIKGTILSQTLIALKTGAVLNGRALAQTSATLEGNTVKP